MARPADRRRGWGPACHAASSGPDHHRLHQLFPASLQFDAAATLAIRRASHRDRVRLWSVAAATGEEPWSLAIALVEAFGRPDPPVEILATDVNAEALEVARRGEYPARAAAAVGAPRWARCFAPVNTERWRIAESCRRLVAFRQLNLAWHVWPVTGAFDVVFCRNVIMYLERDFRHTVLERIRRLLAPGGLLIMHPAEHPGRTTSALACVADGIYERRNPDLPETEPDGARVPLLRRRLRSAGELVNGSALSAARP